MWYRALPFTCVLIACVPEDAITDERAQAAVAGTTVVSLTFDDTFADNFQVGALTEARGMRATFYVNSARVGQAGSLSLAQLMTLRDAGHEIAGHATTHGRLGELDTDEVRRQICDDRESFTVNGFRMTSFAYPFSSQNATVRQIAAQCGYNSARLVGGLVVPGSCSGCPYANPMPPVDPFQVRANDSVDATTTLDRMKLYVTQAEQNGGGWVPMVFHHVCDGCNDLAVSPAVLAEFLDWLRARAAQGTVVATVDQVMGGSAKPFVTATPSFTNRVQNPDLETDANNDQVPDCFQRGGFGTNSASFSFSSSAYSGTRAQRIDMTSFTSGARRLVTAQDSGACAPTVIPGHSYVVGARVMSNTSPIISVYYRTASGSWVWFAESGRLPTSPSTFMPASYTTPPLPAGATHLSFGVSIVATGFLTTDQYAMYDANDGAPPTASLSLPAANSTQRGVVEIYANATDPSGVASVEFLVNGNAITNGVDSTYPYWVAWNSGAFAGQTVTLSARACDRANNCTTTPARQITIASTGDTTPPAVALTSPADGATVTGTITLAADASDAGGIARVQFFANGTLVATDTTAPYELSWDTAPYAGQTITLTAVARDSASNEATSAARTITVAGAAPTNLLQNASLEVDANSDQVPDCWQRGGSGTNSATFTLTNNAFAGSVAQRIDMTSYTSGARRIVSRQDSGPCAPAASAGQRFTVSARYIANTSPVFTIYYRNASGAWVFFAQSPAFPTSSSYALATYTTAPLPTGATHVSVGLSIINLGSLTMDDFSLVLAP